MNIIDILSNIIEITGDKTVDGIILAIIGIISFTIAFDVVGFLYRTIKYHDAEGMSKIHWLVRVLIFLGLAAILTAIANKIIWFFSQPWWIILLTFIGLALLILLIVFLVHRHKKKQGGKTADDDDEKSDK